MPRLADQSSGSFSCRQLWAPVPLLSIHALALLSLSLSYPRPALSLSARAPMQALRLARPRVSLRRNAFQGVRCIAATANASHATPAAGSSGSPAAIPLSNVEAQWEQLSADEQLSVHQQLEEIQKKDWTTLSVDEKKAGT